MAILNGYGQIWIVFPINYWSSSKLLHNSLIHCVIWSPLISLLLSCPSALPLILHSYSNVTTMQVIHEVCRCLVYWPTPHLQLPEREKIGLPQQTSRCLAGTRKLLTMNEMDMYYVLSYTSKTVYANDSYLTQLEFPWIYLVGKGLQVHMSWHTSECWALWGEPEQAWCKHAYLVVQLFLDSWRVTSLLCLVFVEQADLHVVQLFLDCASVPTLLYYVLSA